MTDLPIPVLLDAAARMAIVLAIGAAAVGLLMHLHRGDARFVALIVACAAVAAVLAPLP